LIVQPQIAIYVPNLWIWNDLLTQFVILQFAHFQEVLAGHDNPSVRARREAALSYLAGLDGGDSLRKLRGCIV
jgi:hypothetical protein